MENKAQEIIAKLEKGHLWEGNILQLYAEKVFRYSLRTEEILKNNLTEKILKEFEREVKNKEIISTQINAKPRLAKSTLGILLGRYIHELLKKYKYKKEDEEFGMDNIARDQGEWTKKMREKERMHDIIVVDEDNSLESTGENATVEEAQRKVFSNIQAGRYIHSIFICPQGTMDSNTDIKLEIRNKDKGLIHTRVYYYLRTADYYGWQLIGYADFDVNELIKNWLSIEKVFYRNLKKENKRDTEVLEEWKKKDFYIAYMMRKYKKMELMNKEGIMHSRDLDYADTRKKVVESLKPLAETGVINLARLKNNVKAKIEMEFAKKSMPLSIIGRMEETERVMGILGLYRSLWEINEGIKIAKAKYQKGTIQEEEYAKVAKTLVDSRDEIEKEIKEVEGRIERMITLKTEYGE